MNIRAYIEEVGFIYPEIDNDPESMINFYLDIMNYVKEKKDVTFEWGSGSVDSQGKEVFEGDLVVISYQDENEEGIPVEVTEIAQCIFEDGAFMFRNEEGLEVLIIDSMYNEGDLDLSGFPCCYEIKKIEQDRPQRKLLV